MKDIIWNENYLYDKLFDNRFIEDSSGLGLYQGDSDKTYLSINTMLTSRAFVNKSITEYDTGGFKNNYFTLTNGYFIMPKINDPITGYSTNSTPNGIGGFRLVAKDGDSISLPLENGNMTPNHVYVVEFQWKDEYWILNYSWINTETFSINVNQKTGNPIEFKFEFTGRYYAQSYGGTDQSRYGQIYQLIDKYSENFLSTIDTYYRYFGSGIKTTYTLMPYENFYTEGKKHNALIVNRQVSNYQDKYYYNYGRNWYWRYWSCNNIDSVSSEYLKYGFCFYLNFGNNHGDKNFEVEVQDWIVNNLNVGIESKLCNLTTTSPFTNFSGQLTSSSINIAQALLCNESIVKWDAIEDDECSVVIESNVSLDSGIHWSGWQIITNGGKIPQLNDDSNVSDGYIKFRQTLTASSEKHIPVLNKLGFKIVSPVLKYLLSDGESIKTYKKIYDWVKFPYNITGYMESNYYPMPYECTASSQFGESYKAYKAFNHTNDNSYDCWASANGYNYGWLKYDFGEDNGKQLYKYVVCFRNGTDYNAAPKDWTLKGSNNNIDWEVLDTQTDQIDWTKAEQREFELSTTETYRYYKFDISKNNGNKSYVTVGQILLYAYDYQFIEGSWEEIPINEINKEAFDKYGFTDIENLECSKLFDLDKIKIYASINNLYYSPTIQYNGLQKVPVRDIVKVKETDSLITNWSDYSTLEYQSNATINAKLIESTKPRTVQITTQTLKGRSFSKEMKLRIKNDAPIVNANIINSRLRCIIEDPNFDKVRFNVKLNNKVVYPKNCEFSEWKRGRIDFSYVFSSNEYILNKINVVSIFVEDEYGRSQSVLLTFKGEYGNILFMDENREIYSNDIGEVLKYIDFDTVSSGKMTDVKKIIFKNKSGYPIKNIHIVSSTKYENDELQLSLSNNPFRPFSEISFQNVLYPEHEGTFYARINTNASDKSKTEMYTIKLYAEPLND